MKKKLIGILFCMLLVVPVLSVTVVADEEPELEIEIRWDTKSLTAFIRNIGYGDAYDVNWSFDIEGGVFGFVDYHIGCVIGLLPAGSGTSVENSLFLFGFGQIEITVSIGASNAETMTDTFRGIIIGRYILLRE